MSFLFKNLRLLWVFVYEMPAHAIEAAASDVNAWLETGKALMPPFTRFPLEKLADAHVAVEKGAVGKVLVQCGADR